MGLETLSLLSLAELGNQTQWPYVAPRFTQFLQNLEPTPNQFEDAQTKAEGIVRALNRNFWPNGILQGYVTAIPAGSWAKGTRIRLASDIDLIYLLPLTMQDRYALRAAGTNRQSAILQEVKNALLSSYPTTPISSDGPAVVMDFSSYKVEVIPVFINRFGPSAVGDASFQVFVCNTNNGGSYQSCAPTAEAAKIAYYNATSKGDLIALVRMIKAWKRQCNVPIKSYLLEQLGIEFIAQWENAGNGPYFYDWMMRDFFAYMFGRQNGSGYLPVSNTPFLYDNAWASRVETAAKTAMRACNYERNALYSAVAGEEWQKIFGNLIPKET